MAGKLLKTNIREYEIFIDGEYKETVKGYSGLDRVLIKYDNKFRKKGYSQTEESSTGYVIYTNYKKMKCKFLAYRCWRGFYDCKGKKIYEGDILVDSNGVNVDINEDWNETFYYRTPAGGFMNWYDYPIENMDFIKNCGVKVETSVFETFS